MNQIYSSFSTDPTIYRGRMTSAIIIISICFTVLIARLWYLQINRGQHFEDISRRNHIREVNTPAPRGIIYDRHGKIILNNRPYYNLILIPQYGRGKKHIDQTLQRISQGLNIPLQQLQDRLKKARGLPHFYPVKLVSNLSVNQVELVEIMKIDSYGIDISIEPRRNYTKDTPSHLVGYLREIDPAEIKTLSQISSKGYKLGDYIGKMGLERRYETQLRGIEGYEFFKVDAYGRKTDSAPIDFDQLKTVSHQPGSSLTLTIDFDLQKIAEKSLGLLNGVAIALVPATGEILAMVSHPKFEPQIYEDGLTYKEWKSLSEDLHKPFLDKTTAGHYPPGSTWKPFVALAALEEKIIDDHTETPCHGQFKLGTAKYMCWKKRGHGKMDLVSALRESCDVFFYNIGAQMKIDTLYKYTSLFGFGKITDLNVNHEKPGINPNTAWKSKTIKKPWVAGDTVSVSIGQGYLTVTPMQLAMAYSALANNGKLFRPLLIKRITDRWGNIVEENQPQLKRLIPIKREYFDLVNEGLCQSVNAPHGTGSAAIINKITVCGKTGTAQNASLTITQNQEESSFQYRDHAWFVAFAPRKSPKILVLVLAEYAGSHGGSTAAPIAKLIVQHYLNRSKSPQTIARADHEQETTP